MSDADKSRRREALSKIDHGARAGDVAAELGVSPRTLLRWRKLIAKNAPAKNTPGTVPPLVYPPATVAEAQHTPGTLPWYVALLAALDGALQRAVARTDRIDAQGIASLARASRECADRIVELRAREAASSSAGLTLEQRLSRMTEAARKMPLGMLEIFVLEWCVRNRINMAALRDARLVRAEECE